ncbi:STRUBBELIG-RECEPTOR FAMILY 3-like protein [Drosera capensis]
METDIEAYVRTCLICQQDKIEQHLPGGLLEPLPTPSRPWESVSKDFIAALPKSEGSLAGNYTGSSPGAFKVAKEWHEQADLARSYLNKATKRMKKWADKERRPLEFKEGDLVLVKIISRQYKTVHKGLVRKYEGSFPITKKVGKISYRLDLPPRLKIHPVFHVSNLKPYHHDEEEPERGISKRAPTAAVITSDDKELEEVLAKREVRRSGIPRHNEYFIKWKNLPMEEASWYLSGNQFTGSIPPSLSTLTQLTDLSFSGNNLTREIPNVFQELSGLVNLNIENNQFFGPIPPGFLVIPSFRSIGNPFDTSVLSS